MTVLGECVVDIVRFYLILDLHIIIVWELAMAFLFILHKGSLREKKCLAKII